MNANPATTRTHSTRRRGALAPVRREGARGRRESGGKEADAAKNLEAGSLGLEPLQALEIPQNGQSFVWKCLDENTPDLEKLAISLQARLASAASARRRIIGRGPRGRGTSQPPEKPRIAKVIWLRRRRG